MTGQPFGALIASSSLVVAVLYLAGFSYRWSYYYNFGLQNLVFNFSFQSFLMTSMEMIRQPESLLLSALSLICSLVFVNVLIAAIQRAGRLESPTLLRRVVTAAVRMLGFENPLVTDAIRALTIIYVVYMLSSSMGYTRFKEHIVNSPRNTLPAVTAVIEKEGNRNVVLACGQESESPVNLIGDARAVRLIQQSHGTCSLDARVWRLLYRDDKFVYLFASKAAEDIKGGRPLTIVLPNTDRMFLVME